MKTLDAKEVRKLLNKGQCNYAAQLMMIGAKLIDEPIPEEVKFLLERYSNLFKEPTELPPARDYDHAIELIPGSKPVNLRPYCYSFEQNNAIEEIVANMLKAQTVTASISPFASPMLLVKKKDSSWTLCVDYHKLNEITIKNKYLIPVVEDLLDELHGA